MSGQGVGNAAFLFSTFFIPPVFTLNNGIFLSSGACSGDENAGPNFSS